MTTTTTAFDLERIESNLIDTEPLLQAINEAQPSGEDIRDDASATSPYYRIKDEREYARTIERNQPGESGYFEALSHWKKVRQYAIELLKSKTKDLEVCCWLIESLLREHGLKGLALGFAITEQIIIRYWDTLYPLPDEDGLETRVAPLTGLNGDDVEGSLIHPISWIFVSPSASTGQFMLWQYKQALEVEKISDAKTKSRRYQNGVPKLNDVLQAAKEAPSQYYSDLKQDLQLAKDAFFSLQATLSGRCEDSSPPSSYIKSALDNVTEHLGYLLQESGHDLEPVNEPESQKRIIATQEETEFDPVQDLIVINPKTKIQTRKQALHMLIEVANFFEQTEPHSPLPTLLRRADKWGRLGFAELLKEIIADKNVRTQAYSLTGIDNEE